MLRTTLDELPQHRGVDLGTTKAVLVDQARIDRFADATEDHQWIHVDPDRAFSGPFGGTIAHGYLTLSLVSRYLFELLEVSDASSVVNYGLERVRFPAPVPTGSRLRGHGFLQEVQEVAGGMQTTLLVTITAERSDKPACVAQVLTRFLRS